MSTNGDSTSSGSIQVSPNSISTASTKISISSTDLDLGKKENLTDDESYDDTELTATDADSWWKQGGFNSSASELTREVVIILYTARLFLPGFLQRKVLLACFSFLPIVDFVTDYYTAGAVSFNAHLHVFKERHIVAYLVSTRQSQKKSRL